MIICIRSHKKTLKNVPYSYPIAIQQQTFFLILHKRKIKGLSEFGLNFTLERILSEEEKNTNFYSTNYAWYALCLRPDLSHNALKNYRISTDSIQNFPWILGLFLYERGGPRSRFTVSIS